VSEQPRVGDPRAQKEIDRADVLGELQHRWYGDGDAADVIRWTLDELAELDILRFREPADDPSQDPIWTVRTVEPAPEMADGNTVVKFGDSFWLYPSKLGNGYGRLDWAKVDDSRIIGSVPGTPAAEANPVPPQVLERVREMLLNGQKLRAIKALREACVGLGLKEAKTYAESLPECALGDRLRATALNEPRVFQSDGPEPPEDVTILEKLDYPDDHRFPYAKRAKFGWVNCQTVDEDTSGVHGFKWPPAHHAKYREVPRA
jgi:hypothetical protein